MEVLLDCLFSDAGHGMVVMYWWLFTMVVFIRVLYFIVTVELEWGDRGCRFEVRYLRNYQYFDQQTTFKVPT